MSRVIIEIKDKSKFNTFINFLKEIPYIKFKIEQTENKSSSSEFSKLFGIWKDRDINLKEIRDRAWNRK